MIEACCLKNVIFSQTVSSFFTVKKNCWNIPLNVKKDDEVDES